VLKCISDCYRSVIAFLAFLFLQMRSRYASAALLVALFVAQSAWAANTVLYVDDSAPAAGNGTGWSTAFRVLQDAITYAEVLTDPQQHPTDTVRINVAGGTYYPDRINDSTTGTNDRAVSFSLLQRVSMYGGYWGVTAPSGHEDDRDPATYITYLDGDIGEANDNSDNSYHVVFADDPDISAVNCLLDGVCVRNGNANGSTLERMKGGAIYLDQAHPKIRNCIVKNNTSARRAGGIMCFGTATPVEIRNCKFLDNTATTVHGTGGAIDSDYSITVINCLFQGNSADKWGGAINVDATEFLETRTPVVKLINCTFVDNHATVSDGGAAYILTGGPMTVTNCLFNSNTGRNGGALWTGYVALSVTNCTFVNCSATGHGGAIAAYLGGISPITNCLFFNNHATNGDKDIYDFSALTVTYCAMTELPDFEEGIYHDNFIFGENGFPSTPGFVDNSNNDPRLNDYHLACGSPCINKGLNSQMPADDLDVNENTNTTEKTPDLALNMRIVNADVTGMNIDLGCYEKQWSNCLADVNTSGVVNIDDLFGVITHWGSCSSPCPYDISPPPCGGNGAVDIDDLFAVIMAWGWNCTTASFTNVGSFTSVQDCMDAASEEYEPYSQAWNFFVDKCTQSLCENHIIECDE
jgi:hypothetical protein